MSDPTIEEVALNFKTPEGQTVRYPVTRKNIILGPNGAGKSAIPQAVALALTGAVDHLAGQRVTRDTGLITGMKARRGLDGEMVFARINLSTGENCQWETHRDGSRIKTANHIKPPWVIAEGKEHSPHLPQREVEVVLSSGAKKAREQFLSWACQDIEEEEVTKYLSRCLPEYEQLTSALDGYAPVDKLTHAVKEASSQQRKLNASVKANKALREDLTSKVGAAVDEAKVLAARDTVRRLEVEYEQAVRADAASSSTGLRDQMNTTLGLLRTKEQELRDEAAQVEEDLNDLMSHDGGDDIEFEGMSGALDAFVWAESEDYFADGDKATCPFCSSSTGRTHLVSCHTFYEERVGEMEAKRGGRTEFTNRLDAIRLEQKVLAAKIQRTQQDLENLPVAGESNEVDLEATRLALSDARAELESLSTAAARWSDLRAASQREKEASEQSTRFQTMKIDGQKAIQALLADRTEAFCKRVNHYLPDGWEFGVMVEDDGRDVFYYGLYAETADSRYLRLGLSDGQKAAVMVALCAVLDDMNPVPLSVIVLDDTGWDLETLEDVMLAMGRIPQHVFVTTPQRPTKRSMIGWNIIEVTGEVPARLPLPKLKLPSPPPPEKVEVVSALVLDSMLLADPEPMPSGRVRGGRFRSLKSRVAKEVEKHGFNDVVVAFTCRHPEATFVEGVTAEEFAESVAHFLCPAVSVEVLDAD